jgi:hypothetical protein
MKSVFNLPLLLVRGGKGMRSAEQANGYLQVNAFALLFQDVTLTHHHRSLCPGSLVPISSKCIESPIPKKQTAKTFRSPGGT